MKKISDKSFWIILIISIISLVILTVGVIFLTKKSEKEFYSAGYIISSNKTKTDKYYFNDNTVYKENVFDEYVFKNVDNKEVSTSKDNFIHYLDNSLSLSEMTIDGDENIDINPAIGKVDKDTGNKGEDSTTGNEQNTEPGDNQENGNGSAFEGEITSVIKKGVSVEIITAKTGVNDLSASFQVIDTANRIKNNLELTLININTWERVYTKQLANVSDIQNVNISSLSPNSNYLMTISEENKNSSVTHFQKIFKTESMDDLKLIRELVTTDSLSYSLDFETNNDIISADISLYDYDEEGELKPITHKVINGENNTVVFEGLKSDTTYDVKVDGIVVKNTNYESQERIETSDTTLKKKQILGEILVDIDENGQEFLISMTEPVDTDKSIIKYTYEIYKAEDTIDKAEPVYRFSRRTLKTEKLKIDENNIIRRKDYYFKVIVEYYDKDSDTYEKISLENEKVLVKTDYMTVDVTLDKAIYKDSFTLLTSDFSTLNKISDIEE